MKMKNNIEEDEENKKKMVLVVHRYIKWTCNLMPEITSKILGIKKTNGEISLSDENIDRGPNGKNL